MPSPLTDAQRDLAGQYLRWVGKIVADLHDYPPVRRLGVDDAFQAGCIGLLIAVRNHRPERGSSIPHFALRAIKGAILTAARRQTEPVHVPRSQHLDADAVAVARRPVHAEHLDELPAPENDAGDVDAWQRLVGALPERTQRLLELRYACGMDNVQIAERLGVTGRIVAQVHERALATLRAMTPEPADGKRA